RTNVVIQLSFSGFKFAPRSRDIFFDGGKFRLSRVQLLLSQAHCIGATQSRADKFCTLIGQTRSPGGYARRSCFKIRRLGIERMQIREFFQEIAIGSFALLKPAFYAGKLALAHIEIMLRLVLLLKQRLLLCFQLCNCLSLLARILLPFLFDRFYSFFDPRDSKCDFFLLLLQLFKSNYLVAKLGKICCLRSAFASKVDFTFLQQSLLMTKRHASPLAPDL